MIHTSTMKCRDIYARFKGKAMPMYIRNIFHFLPYLVEMEHLCIREFLGGQNAI